MDSSYRESVKIVISHFLIDYHNNQNFRNFKVILHQRKSHMSCKIHVEYPIKSILDKNVSIYKMLIHQKKIHRDVSKYFGFGQGMLKVTSCIEANY